MTPRDVALSKRLSWLLRHGAGESQLEMDGAGWCEIDDVVRLLDITTEQLERAVADNDKGRLVVEGSRIRACQGHSLINMPVTREALERSWRRIEPAEPLWHGTRTTAINGIAEHGILPGARSHVHLAEASESHVGKRSSSDLLLGVSPARLAEMGIDVFRAPNGVILVREVPAAAIVDVRGVSARGQAAEHSARTVLL